VPLEWRTARGARHADRPIVVGILNVTPDSFWDGGRHADVGGRRRHAASAARGRRRHPRHRRRIDAARRRAGRSAAEIRRVVPSSTRSARWPDVPISVDTVKATSHAPRSTPAPPSSTTSPACASTPKWPASSPPTGAGLILMHSRGGVEDMARYELADYGPTRRRVRAELAAPARARPRTPASPTTPSSWIPASASPSAPQHSLAAARRLDRLASSAARAGRTLPQALHRRGRGGLPAEERLEGTIAACVIALLNGARLFRVHDVAAARRALDVPPPSRPRSAV
jgi:dihydropteroate synthase